MIKTRFMCIKLDVLKTNALKYIRLYLTESALQYNTKIILVIKPKSYACYTTTQHINIYKKHHNYFP